MAYNKTAEGSSMKRRPMRRRKKFVYSVARTMSSIIKIPTS